MQSVPVAAGAVLVLLAAPVGAALVALATEVAASTAVALSTVAVVVLVLVSIAKGTLARERATTVYW